MLEFEEEESEVDKILSNFSKNIWDSSRRFKLSNTTTERANEFKAMMDLQLLRKSLESDEIIFIEGKPSRQLYGDTGFEDLGENMQVFKER